MEAYVEEVFIHLHESEAAYDAISIRRAADSVVRQRRTFKKGECIQLFAGCTIKLFANSSDSKDDDGKIFSLKPDSDVIFLNKKSGRVPLASSDVLRELRAQIIGGKDLETIAVVVSKSVKKVYKTVAGTGSFLGEGNNNDVTCGGGNAGGSRVLVPGILIEAKSGCGKSTLLNSIRNIYGESRAAVLRCGNLRRTVEGDLENDLLEFFRSCLLLDQRLILIDDIDLILPAPSTKKKTTKETSSTLSSSATAATTATAAMATALCTTINHCLNDLIIDKAAGIPRAFVVFTCTDAHTLNEGVFTNEWRRRTITLRSPTEEHRREFFKKVLSLNGILISDNPNRTAIESDDDDVQLSLSPSPLLLSQQRELSDTKSNGRDRQTKIDTFEEEEQRSVEREEVSWLASELAVRTQGCSVADLIKLIHNHIGERQYKRIEKTERHPEIPTITIDAAALITAAANIRPVSSLDQELQQLIVEAGNNKGSGGESMMKNAFFVGLDDVKEKLTKAVLSPFLDDEMAERYRKYNLRPCSGVLIEGPTGCGKTLLAHWLAEEGCCRKFKFLSISCADLVHKVVGASEQRISKVFAAAREMAPCFLLLDNLEIILGTVADDVAEPRDDGKKTTSSSVNAKDVSSKDYDYLRFQEDHNYVPANRRRTTHQALDRMLSTLLVEIDGIGSSFAATSMMTQTHHQKSWTMASKHTREGSEETTREGSAGEAHGGSAGDDDDPTGDSEGGEEDDDWDWDDMLDGSGGSGVKGVSPGWRPVVVIATTANAALLDRAIKRPGRLEEFIRIPTPDITQICALLSHFVKTSMSKRTDVLTWIDRHTVKYSEWNTAVAQRLKNKSPADIKFLVQESLMELLRKKCLQTTTSTSTTASTSTVNSNNNRISPSHTNTDRTDSVSRENLNWDSDSKVASTEIVPSKGETIDDIIMDGDKKNSTMPPVPVPALPKDLVELYDIIWKKCPVNYFSNQTYVFQ